MEVKESQDPVTETDRKQRDQKTIRQCGIMEAYRTEHFEKNRVINTVKCSQEVQEDEDWTLPVGIGLENIIGKRQI